MKKYLETATGKPQRKSLEERLREHPQLKIEDTDRSNAGCHRECQWRCGQGR